MLLQSKNKISVYWTHLFMTGQFWAISPPRMTSADCSRSGIRTLSKLSQVIRILCSLQVGTWSAMTGYGLAFPHNSKHKTRFNDMLLEYKENGDLERLSRWPAEYVFKFSSTNISRFWLHGVCKPNMQEKRASEPLSIDQFLSAFLLLVLGKLLKYFNARF